MEKWKIFYLAVLAVGFAIGVVADMCIEDWKTSSMLGVAFIWLIIIISEYRESKEKQKERMKKVKEILSGL